jgi:glucose-6-phosphate 1-epimerase
MTPHRFYGATVSSWKVGGKEKLFVSSTSAMDGTKPVCAPLYPRTGVLIRTGPRWYPGRLREFCAMVLPYRSSSLHQPIFGPPPSSPPEYASLKQHGFARTQTWSLESVVMDRAEGVSVRLTAPAPPSDFPHSYSLQYVVVLSAHQISTDLHIVNKGDNDFIFQALLHSYLAVPDVSKIKITGMDKGISYRDKVLDGKMEIWDQDSLAIDKETDRYVDFNRA